ncbi:hypothetical protein EYF80_009710 [Liparis tanakae]|uniref:Uncharacterized protein n=1 Tax=Liparis tanakae TaxID=230148 RepID=A0A4Z2IQ16_9TELE|nr:hypothetical protein EYF80_009710 [Liparis tanakae]
MPGGGCRGAVENGRGSDRSQGMPAAARGQRAGDPLESELKDFLVNEDHFAREKSMQQLKPQRLLVSEAQIKQHCSKKTEQAALQC